MLRTKVLLFPAVVFCLKTVVMTYALTSQHSQAGYSKLVTVGGYNINYIDTVQVIDLANPNTTCDQIQPYPKEVRFPNVGFVDGILKACGGYLESTDCFDYDPTASEDWVPAPSMVYSRFHSQSSIIDNQWLITGDDDSPADTTPEVWDGTSFQEADMQLPERMYFHCQITLSDSTLFLADLWDSNMFYIVSYPFGVVLAQGSIRVIRQLGSCGLINSPSNGQEIVIAGYGTSDILNLETLEFRDGPYMPDSLQAMASVQYEDTFLLVGGERNPSPYDDMDTIYQFDNVNYEWILLDQRLEEAAYWVGATLVPDDFVNCS